MSYTPPGKYVPHNPNPQKAPLPRPPAPMPPSSKNKLHSPLRFLCLLLAGLALALTLLLARQPLVALSGAAVFEPMEYGPNSPGFHVELSGADCCGAFVVADGVAALYSGQWVDGGRQTFFVDLSSMRQPARVVPFCCVQGCLYVGGGSAVSFPGASTGPGDPPGVTASPVPLGVRAGAGPDISIRETRLANGELSLHFSAELTGLDPGKVYIAGFMTAAGGEAFEAAGDSLLISRTESSALSATAVFPASQAGREYRYMLYYYSLDGKILYAGEEQTVLLGAGAVALETARPTPAPRATDARPAATPRPTATLRPTETPYPEELPRPQSEAYDLYDASMRCYVPQLTPAQRGAFIQLYDGAMAFQKVVPITGRCSKDDLDAAFDTLCYDCPELFQLDKKEYTFQTMDDLVVSVEFAYAMPPEQYQREREQMISIVEGLASQPGFAADDYSRQMLIYRYLMDHVEYRQDAPFSGEANGAYLYGYAKCDGYVHALNLALRYYGIPCAEVVGGTYDNGVISPTQHSWSLVCIQGQWYQADLTWDDEPLVETADGQPLYLPYFNVTDAQMMSARTYDAEILRWRLPTCRATADNYYVRNGLRIPKDVDLEAAFDTAVDMAYQNGWDVVAFSMESANGFNRLMVNGETLMRAWRQGRAQVTRWRYLYTYETGLYYLFDIQYSR